MSATFPSGSECYIGGEDGACGAYSSNFSNVSCFYYPPPVLSLCEAVNRRDMTAVMHSLGANIGSGQL